MSQVTENTILIRKEAEEDLLHDLTCEEVSFCRIRGVRKVFDGKRHVLYVFDCNGNQPWDVADKGVLKLKTRDVLCTETGFGEGETWTRLGRDGYLWDTPMPLKDAIRPYIPEGEYERVVNDIAYSI